MTNPLRGGRGRPLHPVLVHFPAALYPASLLFDWLSYLTDDGTPYVKGAYALIVAGLVVSVAVAVTGFADFLTIENGSRAWRLAFTHLTVMLVTTGLFVASALLRRRDLDVTSTPFGLLVLDAFAVALLAFGAVLGHDLVFRHGQRVEAEPPAPGGQEQQAPGLGSDLSRP
jgi:uncharacterized membrane protein